MNAGAARRTFLARLDDIRGLSAGVRATWDRLEARGMPVHLEVVPGDLDPCGAEAIAGRAAICGVPVEVHQHGFRHWNHGTESRRFEFDDARRLELQLADISRGREILEERLSRWFRPIFSPPWNRAGASTLEALARAGFVAVSRLDRPGLPAHSRIRHLPMTTDPVAWGPLPAHRPWAGTTADLLRVLEERGMAGLILHPDVMLPSDIEGLDVLLEEIARSRADVPAMAHLVRERADG